MHGEPSLTGLRGENQLSTREPDPDNTGGGIAFLTAQSTKGFPKHIKTLIPPPEKCGGFFCVQ